jgi:hypothetical protein
VLNLLNFAFTMKYYLTITVLLFSSFAALSQATGDYRTNTPAGGDWNSLSNWERWNGSAWVAPTPAQGTPTSASGIINIQTGHTMNANISITVDQVVVNGTLNINTGITFSAGPNASMISVGSAGTLNVNGTITITTNNSASIANAGNINFNAGSRYIHDSNNANGGVIPTAIWNIASTFVVAFSQNISYTITSGSWSQTFGHVEINITSNGNRTNNFSGLLTTIGGNFTIIQNTGNNAGSIWLASSGNNVINVGGDFNMVPNRNLLLAANPGTITTLNVSGNFNHAAGTITATGTGTINFNGSSVQTYTRTGTISGNVNYAIASGSTLDVGSNTMTGDGTFNLSGELRLGIATGLNGILLNTGAKTFNANSTLTYNGNVDQVLGSLYPASPAPGINLVVDKSGSQLSNPIDFSITGDFNFISGTFNAASITITISGDIDINGTFIHGDGTLNLNGANTQTFNAGDEAYYEITVNKSGGDINLSGPLNLVYSLDIQSSTVLNTNGNLTLLSTGDRDDESASILALQSGADVIGEVTVQRFIALSSRLYRYLSTPVQGTTIADWQPYFSITGNFTGRSTTNPYTGLTSICGTSINPNSASLFIYNEAASGGLQNGWLPYPTTTAAAAVEPGKGYAAFIRETCERDVVIVMSGEINKGDINLNPSYTNHGSLNDDGWNLVGNPYPAAIEWDPGNGGWTLGTDIVTSIDIRDNINGQFITLTGGPGAYISPGQAFWVKADGPANQLIIHETAKVNARDGATFYRVDNQQARDLLTINLTKGNITDKAYFKRAEGASKGRDRHDFPNQNNDLFDVATLEGGRQLAVNAVPELDCEETVQVHVKDMTNGSYQFSIDREGIFLGYKVVLHDKYTGAKADLTSVEQYAFSITADAASKSAERFELLLSKIAFESIETEVESTSVCGDENFLVNILNPVPGYEYFAEVYNRVLTPYQSVTSADAILTLSIPTNIFKAEVNPVFIKARSECFAELPYEEILVSKEALFYAEAASATVCNNGQTTLAATGAPANAIYHWYESEDTEQAVYTGASFTTPILYASTTYFVTAVNSLGCEGPRFAVDVIHQFIEEASIEVYSRNKLTSNYSSGNQWYFEGEPIPGGKTQVINANKSGEYTLEVSVNGCITSASYYHIVVRANNQQPLIAFPNPVGASEKLNIEIEAEQLAEVILYNAFGRPVSNIPMQTTMQGVWRGTVDVSSLNNGIYFVRAMIDGKMHNLKVVRKP